MHNIEYGKTKDGLTAAAILTAGESYIYAMIPCRSGYYIATKFGGTKNAPLSELTNSDFFGHSGNVETFDEFKNEMSELAIHYDQLDALERKYGFKEVSTPWGKSDHATVICEGAIIKYSTPGHGGYKVYASHNRQIPEPFRQKGGWYEEDSDYAKVVFSFPSLFTDLERRHAIRCLKNYYPDEYEAVTGEEIPDGESRIKDERKFYEAHANDWIVVSALGLDDGTVECHAVIGGRPSMENGADYQMEKFIVPQDEYHTGGFVIDPSRHPRVGEETTAPKGP